MLIVFAMGDAAYATINVLLINFVTTPTNDLSIV